MAAAQGDTRLLTEARKKSTSTKLKKTPKSKPDATFKSAEFVRDSSSDNGVALPSIKAAKRQKQQSKIHGEESSIKAQDLTKGVVEGHQKRKVRAKGESSDVKPSKDSASEDEQGGSQTLEAAPTVNGSMSNGNAHNKSATNSESKWNEASHVAESEAESGVEDSTGVGYKKASRKPVIEGDSSHKRPARHTGASGSDEEDDEGGPTNRADRTGVSTTRETAESESSASEGEDPEGREDAGTRNDAGSDDGSETGKSSVEEATVTDMEGNLNTPAIAPSTAKKLPPFKPPVGFVPANISSTRSDSINALLDPSKLEGKHIWHITAPESLPMSIIQEVSAQSLPHGSAITSFEGSEYGFVPLGDDKTSRSTILLPSVNENAYIARTSPIQQSMYLQQMVKLPIHTITPASTSEDMNARRPSPKPRNEQPDGLKMRSHAFGIPGAALSDAEPAGSSPINSRPQFKHPDTLAVPLSPTKKRKRKSVDADIFAQPIPSSNSKTSKKPKPNSEAPSQADTTPMDIDSLTPDTAPTSSVPKTSKKRRHVSITPSQPPRNPKGTGATGDIESGEADRDQDLVHFAQPSISPMGPNVGTPDPAPSSSKAKKMKKQKVHTTTPSQPAVTPKSIDTSFHMPKEYTTATPKASHLEITPTDTTNTMPRNKESKDEREKRKAGKHQNKLREPFRIPQAASPFPPSEPTPSSEGERAVAHEEPQATAGARASQVKTHNSDDGSPDRPSTRPAVSKTNGFVKASTLNHASTAETAEGVQMNGGDEKGVTDAPIRSTEASAGKLIDNGRMETAEERAARKAAKKARKQARQSRRDSKAAAAAATTANH